MTMFNMDATWGDVQDQYNRLPLDEQGLLFGMTEARVFQQDPDELVFGKFNAMMDALNARDEEILSRIDFASTDMWAGIYQDRLVPFLFFGGVDTGVVELILDKNGLHDSEGAVSESVRHHGHDVDVEDLALQDLSHLDGDAKRRIWSGYMPGERSSTDYPTTRSVFVRTPLEEHFRTKYPAWWAE
ncbi:hypothetical protein F7P69_14825 [Cellulosimicrobium funkei]|nr:hypothetical protein [Cellulosimicrobium funkei]